MQRLAEPALRARLRYTGHFGTLMPFYRAWDKLSHIQDPLKLPKKVRAGLDAMGWGAQARPAYIVALAPASG
jgi:hypothetical protein